MKLSAARVAEQFHSLLDGLGADVFGLYLGVERKLNAVGALDVSWHMATGDPGLVRGLLGKRRDLLIVEHARLREFAVVISARGIGTALHVSWMLMASPRIANDLLRTVRITPEGGSRYDLGSELDLLDALDLNGFVALTQLALKSAIRELTKEEPDDGPEQFSDLDSTL